MSLHIRNNNRLIDRNITHVLQLHLYDDQENFSLEKHLFSKRLEISFDMTQGYTGKTLMNLSGSHVEVTYQAAHRFCSS